jgi:hypothetical protein
LNKVACATQYIAEKSLKAYNEKEVQDPYNSKPEGSDLKTDALAEPKPYKNYIGASLYIKTHSQNKRWLI